MGEEDTTDPKARPLPAPEREATPKGPGRLTSALQNMDEMREEIAELREAEAEQSGAHEVEQVKTRHETLRLVGDRLTQPTTMLPILGFLLAVVLTIAGVVSGTFDFGTAVDAAAEKVP